MTRGVRLDSDAFETVYAATGNKAAAARAAGSTAKTVQGQSAVAIQLLNNMKQTEPSRYERIKLAGRHPVTREGLVAAAADVYDASMASGEGFTGATAVSSLRLLAQVAQLLVEEHNVNVGMQPSEAIAAALRAAEADQGSKQDG